ncbi:MAG TPA: flagellar filament capping protein FliD [Gemmatimonadales bacterium]|nr:flagellar filament capping protein FliD [Gemmatimonadales bacterium]
MTAPLVSFSGLASGFDYRSLVDAIIQQERQPAARLETQLDKYANQQTALTAYRSRLTALRTAAKALQDGTAFDATTSTATVVSGSKAVATVATSPATAPGSFRLAVTQLARTEKLAGTGMASSTDPLAQTGTITINGVDIDVTAADSLGAIRDRINALDTGASPIGVRATILSVSPTDNRLVLTSGASGAAGITLADTTGSVLQSLGLQDGAGSVPPAAVLVDGADAFFTIDGVALTRTSNVVSDALEGVTLTLTSEEAGAVTDISVGRFADAARGALQAFVDAYNGLVDFMKSQSVATDSSRPALYNDSLIRGLRRDLPSNLLASVLGAAPDLATAASVGLSLDREGKLSLDNARFESAFNNRYDDLRTLFGEQRTATSPDVAFVSSGQGITGGSWDVEITATATTATTVTSGFSGVYDAGIMPDVLTLTDTASGRTADVTLTTGMTTAQIVTALSDAATLNGLSIEVTAEGNEIRITHLSSGSSAGIDISVSGTGDGASEAWSAPVSVQGTDVAGTIGGEPATGSGNMLVGDTGTSAAGIAIRYTGVALGSAGSVDLTVGTGAAVERLLDRYVETGGILDLRANQLGSSTERATDRVSDIDRRLEHRRANLLKRFVAMEAAIARLQQASNGFLSSLAPKSGTNS